MKNKILILIALFTVNFAKAQFITIPDVQFAAWLNANIPAAMSGNQMDTSSTLVTTLFEINVENLSIADLTGVQYFTSLYRLDCGNGDNIPNPNTLSSLPPLPLTLRDLICGNNQLTNLPILPSTLQFLSCYKNNLISLPVLPNNLYSLDCSFNLLETLPALSDSLNQLACHNNQLTSLPFLPNKLRELYCYNNQLTSLPSLPSSLFQFDCGSNLLSSLPVLPNFLNNLSCQNNYLVNLPFLPNSIKFIRCHNNQISSLPALPDSLNYFAGHSNQLTDLPSLPNTITYLQLSNNQISSFLNLPDSLIVLSCQNNTLTSLPALPSKLQALFCSNNNISCFPVFPNTISTSSVFSILNNPFTCLPNYIPSMDAATLAYPLCINGDTINNINGCADASRGILGFVFTDNNSNCIKDSGDLNLVNVHEMLYDNNSNLLSQTYSAINGIYDFPDSAGTYIIKIDTANVPFIVQCPHPGIDSTVTLTTVNPFINNLNFSFACKPGFDIGVQSVITNNIAFPGQIHSLRIVGGDLSQWYNLACAVGVSGQVQVTVTGPVTYYNTTIGALTPTVVGNIFTYNISDFGTINNTHAFGLLFTTDTTAQAGDTICVNIAVSPSIGDNNPANNNYNYCYYVSNSHDPNSKEVYPVNVMTGYHDYLTYTIHFQNTGTAQAINIRLVDTLNNNLDLSTFQVTNYSHYNIVSLQQNVFTVRFPNINLPDSTSNFEGSRGFVQYRIKPKINLLLGTQIKNTASIYFDYNTPIVTNTTTNEYVQTVSIQNNIIKTALKIYPNPAINNITIESKNSIAQNFVISIKNIQGREVLNEKINFYIKHTINVNNLCNGIYILSLQNEMENNRFMIIIQK